MLLSEMYSKVVLEAGQFQLPDQKIELAFSLFKKSVELTLGIYNKHSPYVVNIYKEINDSRTYTFTETNTPQGVPEWLSGVAPIRIFGTYPYLLNNQFMMPNSYLEEKKQFPWIYRKPTLTLPISGEFDITAIYHHKIIGSSESDYEIVTIDDHDSAFFKILTGKFLKSLGRARRSFRLDGLPIADDGDSLVSEGKDLESEGLEELFTNKQKWYLAWGD